MAVKQRVKSTFVDDEEGNLDGNTTDPAEANNGGTPFFNDKMSADKYNLNKTNVTANIRRLVRVIVARHSGK